MGLANHWISGTVRPVQFYLAKVREREIVEVPLRYLRQKKRHRSVRVNIASHLLLFVVWYQI
jgi:hypothetical protein